MAFAIVTRVYIAALFVMFQVVNYELYSDSQTFSRGQLAAFSNQGIPLEFFLPESQPPTFLASAPPTHWEVEVAGKSSHVNLQAFFLVPVYKAV